MASSHSLLVEEWLEHLGHREYLQSFIDNGYDDIEVCRQIGKADLDAIGVENHLHRKLILDGVFQLCSPNSHSHFGAEKLKPMYFILENPNSPSKNKLTCGGYHGNHSNNTQHSNPSSVNSSLSNRSTGISSASSTSGISLQIVSSSSEETSIDFEASKIDAHEDNPSNSESDTGTASGSFVAVQPKYSCSTFSNVHSNISVSEEMSGTTLTGLLPTNCANKRHPSGNFKKSSKGGKLLLDIGDSFEMEEIDSSTTKTSWSFSSSLKSQTTKNSGDSSMEDLDQRLSRLQPSDSHRDHHHGMRPSQSYTTGCYPSHFTRGSEMRHSISEGNSSHMISAYGHFNRSVPPPLPRCPPPGGNCTDVSQSQQHCGNSRNRSKKRRSQTEYTIPATSSVLNPEPSIQPLLQHPGEVNSAYAASLCSSQNKSSSLSSSNSSRSSVSSLKRLFSFRKSGAGGAGVLKKVTNYKPPAGDLVAHEITMSDEDRIRLMIMVKEGTLSMHEALATVKQYELEKKKGVNKNLNHYLNSDSIKIPVSPEKSSKPSPFRFLRSFSFRSSRRRKLCHDLEYYYREEEKRQKNIRDRMAAVDVGDESTYSRPQCCSNKSCDESGPCRNSTCTLNQRRISSPTGTSGGASSCDTHLYCYGTCSKAKSATPHGNYNEFNENCSGSPKKCYISRTSSFNQSSSSVKYNDPLELRNKNYDQYGQHPLAQTCDQYGMMSDNRNFNRKFGGRHSFHGVPTATHSDVITFVHHHVQSPLPGSSMLGETVCNGTCRDHSVVYSASQPRGPGMFAQCPSGMLPLSPPSQCLHPHRSVVTNSILEEQSPCASSDSSTENLHVGAVSVQASVHRSDPRQSEDTLNNNSQSATRSGNHGFTPVVFNGNQSQLVKTFQSQPDSMPSERSNVSQHSTSSESELPIEQYKPKNQTPLLPVALGAQCSDQLESFANYNGNPEMEENCDSFKSQNIAVKSGSVQSHGVPNTVEQLCEKLSLEHLLPLFLDNGFETLELFKQLDDEDLTTLGITDVTDRAKILTAVTLLPEEEPEYDLSSYTYKSVKNTGIYSKVGESSKIAHKIYSNCSMTSNGSRDGSGNRTSTGRVSSADRNQNVPAAAAPLILLDGNSPRDSGCYMEQQLNSSTQSQC